MNNERNNAPAVPQGYEIHEIPADYSGLVWLEGQVRAVARLAQAATGPQGWTDADSDAARLALELECLLMDTKDLSVVSKWWASANDALELHRQRLGATPAPAPAQESGESVQLRGLDDSSAMLRVRTIIESKACYLAGSTIAEIVAAAKPAQEMTMTDEEIDAIASKYMSTVGDHWCNEEAIRGRHAEDFARAIIAALRAKGRYD